MAANSTTRSHCRGEMAGGRNGGALQAGKAGSGEAVNHSMAAGLSAGLRPKARTNRPETEAGTASSVRAFGGGAIW